MPDFTRPSPCFTSIDPSYTEFKRILAEITENTSYDRERNHFTANMLIGFAKLDANQEHEYILKASLGIETQDT